MLLLRTLIGELQIPFYKCAQYVIPIIFKKNWNCDFEITWGWNKKHHNKGNYVH